jgi:hypothetical protein
VTDWECKVAWTWPMVVVEILVVLWENEGWWIWAGQRL